jgi:integrase
MHFTRREGCDLSRICQDLDLMRSDWPLIHFRATTPGHPWMIDCGLINGKRIRYSCRTKAEALDKAAELRAQRRRNGEDSLAPKALSEDALAAARLLAPHDATLLAAAKFYVANLEVIAQAKSVNEVVAEFIRAKQADGLSPRYLKDLRVRLGGDFSSCFGTRAIYEVTHSELEDWLRIRGDWSPTNRNNYRRVIGTLFGFALARGLILKDPTLKVARAKVTPAKPGILSVDEAWGLLAAAGPDMRAPLALLLFAGLRPMAELLRLDWSAINFGDRSIDIGSSKNSASHRFVKMSDNLIAWLEPHQRDCGSVSVTSVHFYEKVKKVRATAVQALRRAGVPCPALEDWPNDCLRHTFASMHYAAFKHAHETAEQMGHTDLKMFFRYYRNRVKEAEAQSFWKLYPQNAL